ncbi:hypothetical protein ASPWEDRAFT_442664 [Aspergillus wentii DTO 134E9]|uniref:Elongator complex protein 5 n=1 Tax=Aspergillus wentii DTO 134E9 TaxID=1073089 RepID=A0A1L9RQG9_ASPWE|nr:uncharacterized protein ASPWEDRAFT_442664 [Aspergillus wentii DTO 134E9]KAI9928335.1 hypothetical protein MW887_002373 [Aspergillus wentii]OJJ37181.1 hypothetical protein ASPWEDRAFT_442664 [Aspergillus wentii DTO 134E9]
MGPVRSIYSFDSVTDFLKQVLYNDACATTLVICSTRDHFLGQLFTAIRNHTDETGASDGHQLSTKTIGLLANSSKIRLLFCPTLENLRACLSALHSSDVKQDTAHVDQQGRRPLLAVLNLLALHVSTSEFSAQGLSRTFANVVEVSSRMGMNLVLCECRDILDPSNERGEALWNVHVPLLNGSVRFGGDESTLRGRSVPVKRVAQRWFEFNEKIDQKAPRNP